MTAPSASPEVTEEKPTPPPERNVERILRMPMRHLSLSVGLALRGEKCFQLFKQQPSKVHKVRRLRPEDVTAQ